ncbi:FxSxx-COOH system tetratricopeptide repeat protein [Lentzea sp. NPDC058436]|uniref:FxSxx-COOH system tetratricopeptide repeat protein n=1 Tax=Lentzea sp. NPDC058436 TaxID=3346499 RepID=UPI0036641B02
MEPGIDDDLAKVLGSDGPEVKRWAVQVGAELRYAGWEDRGNTAARLVAAYVTWNRLGGTGSFSGKLILKYIPFRWKETEEPWRTADAWDAADEAFRDAHLVRQIRDPVMLPNGGWLMFLDVASGKLSGLRSLSNLLEKREFALLADHASVVVRQMLGALAPVEDAYPTVAGLLSELLGARIEPNGTVHKWLLGKGLVTGKPVAAVDVQVDGLPNPVSFVLGGLSAGTRKIRVRLTGSHRDMHPGNCLTGRVVGEFWLIDQARFASSWLAAFDPMYLVVTTVAHLLPSDADQRRDVIRLLVDPEAPPDLYVPMPLRDFVIAVRTACADFGAEGNLDDEWQVESLVALIAVALIMTGRSLIDETDREWFLHLAANAAARLTSLIGTEDTGAEDSGARSSVAADGPVFRDAAAPRADEPIAVDLPVLLPYLVSRGQLVSRIKELHTVRPGQVVALHGPPGVGKSQAAVEYAHTFGTGYSHVVWFSGGPLLTAQFAEFARGLGIAAESVPDVLRSRVFKAMRESGQRFLLVFDGVDTASEIRPFCPFSPEVDVLVTSRSPQWTQMGKLLPVGPFERAESVGLLESIIDPAEGTDALAQALDDLPAAVAQAGHYLVGLAMSPQRYREQVLREPESTLAKGPLDDYGALGLVWATAIDQLRLRSPRAADALNAIAFCGSAPVPVELVPDAGEGQHETFDDIVKILTESGLVTASGETLSCYALLRSFVRNRCAPDQAEGLRLLLGRQLVDHHPGDPRSPRTWRRYHELLPHIVEIGPLLAHGRNFLKLYLDSVHYLIVQGDAATAIGLAEKARTEWGEDDEAMVDVLDRISQAHFYRGDYDTSVRLDAEILDRARRAFGENHPDTVMAQKHVAASTAALSRDPRNAMVAFEQIVNRHDDLLGSRHPETLRALHNQAHFLRAAGQLERALEIDRRNFQTLGEVLGSHHVDTLKSGHAFGLDLTACGDHEAARQVNERVHDALLEVFGPAHPQTAQSAISLADNLHRAGEFEAARRLNAAARETLLAARGADHGLTLLATHGLAKNLLALGDVEQAASFAEDTYERRARLLEPDSLQTVRSGSLLAQVLERRGDGGRARELKARMTELLTASHRERS